MNILDNIRAALNDAKKPSPAINSIYFKTGPGQYAEHDQFIGVTVPDLRKIAKCFNMLSLTQLQDLIKSPYNEERLLALFILIQCYQRNDPGMQEIIYMFYIDNLNHINNWNLVDSSAHLIIGAHLLDKDKGILDQLALSENLWERRIAIVSTWYFIRHRVFEPTLTLANTLLHDEHDLIHKAVGWMLRELGKRDNDVLVEFLDKHAHVMPRTMLRYAIEKFTKDVRQCYLSK